INSLSLADMKSSLVNVDAAHPMMITVPGGSLQILDQSGFGFTFWAGGGRVVEKPPAPPIAAAFCARICAAGRVIERTAATAATLCTLSLAYVRRKGHDGRLTVETRVDGRRVRRKLRVHFPVARKGQVLVSSFS